MRWLMIVGVCLTSIGCGTVRSAGLFDGEVFRVDTPWYDSRNGERKPTEMSKPSIDLAIYCFPEDNQWSPSDVPQQPATTKKGRRAQAAGSTENRPMHKCTKTAYAKAHSNAIWRDRLQDILIAASNEECDRHKSRAVGTHTSLNLGLSSLSSLLSGAATGFTAASTKTFLAAGATLLSSSRAQLNEQVYRQLFVGTVLTAIDDDRQTQLLDIMSKRRYPVPNNAWDPRAQGRPLRTSTGHTQADESDDNEIDAGDNEEATDSAELIPGESAVNGLEALNLRSSAGEPPANGREPRSDADLRQFYGIDEAVRDAAAYHTRCSFYSGLVQVSTTVEEFSPCRLLDERRERLLAEVAAIGDESVFQARKEAYTAEIEILNTKLGSCTTGGGA